MKFHNVYIILAIIVQRKPLWVFNYVRCTEITESGKTSECSLFHSLDKLLIFKILQNER